MKSLQAKTVVEYDYSDIQKKLCEYMGIDEEGFRVFEYPGRGWVIDYWRMFITLFEPTGNDTHNRMVRPTDQAFARKMLIEEGHADHNVDSFLVAVSRLFEEYGNDKNTIHYWLSW